MLPLSASTPEIFCFLLENSTVYKTLTSSSVLVGLIQLLLQLSESKQLVAPLEVSAMEPPL